MAKRSTTKGKVVLFRQQRDFNQMARAVVERVEQIADAEPGKNPAAVELGRKGGLKGGRARMDSLTHEQRRQLGLKGARARWRRPKPAKG
jgi:hypothetical protein